MKRTITRKEAATAAGVSMELVTTRQGAAETLHTSVWTIDRWIAEGVLPVVRFPGSKDPEGRSRRVLIAVADLEALIRTSRETKAG